MAELLFKKGLHANLAAAAKKAGTLYVTTDEKCLYLDVSDTERIRLQGSVLYYSTLEEFYKNEQPPYSTDVIYFIEKDSEGKQFNALMRWNAASSEWIQLNATASSVDKAIAELQRQITANANTLKSHGTSLEGIMTRLATVEGYVGAPAHKNEAGEDVAASGLHAAVATNASDIDAIETAIGDDNTAGSIKGRIKAVEGEIGDDNTANSVKGRIKAVEGRASALEGTAENHGNRIKALEDAPAKALQSDFKALYDQVNTGDNSLVKQIEGNDTDILNLQNNKADKTELERVEKALDDYKDAVELTQATKEELAADKKELQDQITPLTATVGTQSENSTSAGKTLWEAVESNDADIAEIKQQLGDGTGENSITTRLKNVEDKAKANGEAIEGIKTDLGIPEEPAYSDGVTNLYGQVAKNKEAIADHETRVDNLETAVGDADNGLVKKAEDNRLAIAKNAEDIGKNAGAIKDVSDALDLHAENAAKTYETIENVAKIKTELDSKILAANAMRYMGTAATAEALPTIADNDISVGDTYVAAGEFELNGTKVHVGDLLIAKGTEGTEGFIMSDLAWDIVDTGYIESHENKLALEETSDNVSANIKLQGYAGNDLSAVAIKSTCSNITVNVANDALEIGLQWAEF